MHMRLTKNEPIFIQKNTTKQISNSLTNTIKKTRQSKSKSSKFETKIDRNNKLNKIRIN